MPESAFLCLMHFLTSFVIKQGIKRDLIFANGMSHVLACSSPHGPLSSGCQAKITWEPGAFLFSTPVCPSYT